MSQIERYKYIIAAVVLVALAGVGYVLFMKDGASNTAKYEAKALPVLAENVLGKEDAPITIIEFSSLTCPHCAVFHNDTLPELKTKYIDTGKVKYILREFPLDQLALAGFMLGRCMEKRSAYFDFIDLLYAKQREWATAKEPQAALMSLAQQVGFSEESFKKCIENRELISQVLAVKNTGMSEFQIRSTPTFFVNGTRVEGAQPLEEFEKIMKPILDKE